MLTLYPAIKPYEQYEMAVDAPHVIYFEESGSPTGIPVLFVHGGPGAGCTSEDRRFFDPDVYRIVLFDQRGCGRSTPHAELQDNTTHALIRDMEKIRIKLNIDKWVLFGGSWGTTLSLAYAQAHPERVLGLILRGIFLARPRDLDWLYQEGANRLFPDAWQSFLEMIPMPERENMVKAYYTRLTGDDELVQMASAKLWAEWEARCSTLAPSQNAMNRLANAHTARSLARIETHYFHHNAFLESNQLLANAHKLEHIPGILIHGRYDVICPLDNAFALNRVWPKSRLTIVRDAGHSAFELGTSAALIKATQEMALELR